jgi:hypothetical protein
MGKSSWSTGSLLRAEQSGNLDANVSNRIFQIAYSPDYDTDMTMDWKSTESPNVSGDETLLVNKPIIINEYKVTVASNDLVMLHQYYGDIDEYAELLAWNTTSPTFHRGLKQWTMCPGGKQKYIDTSGVNSLEHSNMYATRSLTFKRKKGARPIQLSKNKGSCFGMSVSNLSGNDDAFFWACVEIKKWKILD